MDELDELIRKIVQKELQLDIPEEDEESSSLDHSTLWDIMENLYNTDPRIKAKIKVIDGRISKTDAINLITDIAESYL